MSKLSTRTRKWHFVNGRMCAGFFTAFCFFCCDGFPNPAQLGCGFPNPWDSQGVRYVKPRLMQSSGMFFRIENPDTQLRGITNPTRRGGRRCSILAAHSRTVAYASGLSCDCAAGMPHLLSIPIECTNSCRAQYKSNRASSFL